MFFRFPPDARWNPERSVVEFGIGVGEYEGVVRISRRVFQILLTEAPTPERFSKPITCTGPGSNSSPNGRFAAGGHVEITGRDLRERSVQARHPRPIGYRRAAS